jgi:predicted TIM-barrel fold metal-dependent hydrolase
LNAIDCDVHPTVSGLKALAPYLDDFWRNAIEVRGMESVESASYPPNAPLTARADWRDGRRRAATDAAELGAHVCDGLGADIAILNCLYGVQLVLNEDMALAFTRAVNDWVRAEWLDRDPRLRASIVLPMHNVEHAVEELERCAADPRFVQALLLVMGEVPLGRRSYWPVYAAAERLGLPIGIHAGSSFRHPVTSLGWPSYYLEDYAAQAQGFQSQLTSLITEGVFAEHPGLKVVLIESGVTWLPGFMWRLNKFWRGLRFEVPWVDRTPMEIVRDHVRLTIQPFDAPDDAPTVARLIDHFRSDDMLLFASDYPHWQFDGGDAMPPGISPALARRIRIDNPLATYTRLGGPTP